MEYKYYLSIDPDKTYTVGITGPNVIRAFKNTFFHQNAEFYEQRFLGLFPERCDSYNFNRLVIPSLDKGMPVIVAIGSDGNIGHAVIVDGYGYEKGNPSRILYHVLMGNGGDPQGPMENDDGWYTISHSPYARQTADNAPEGIIDGPDQEKKLPDNNSEQSDPPDPVPRSDIG